MTKARRAALDFFILDVCIDVKLPWLAMSSSHYICITYNAHYVLLHMSLLHMYIVHCTAVGKSTWALGSSQQPPAAIEQSHWAAWALWAVRNWQYKADCLAVLTAWLTAVFGAASSQGRKTMNGDVLLFRRVLLQAPSWKISLQGISNIMRKLYYIVYNAQWTFFCFPIYLLKLKEVFLG